MDFLIAPLENLSKWGQHDLFGVPEPKPKEKTREGGGVGDWMHAASMDVAQGQKFWWADQPPHFTITVEEASGLTLRGQDECFFFVRLEHGTSIVSTQFALGTESPYWNDAFRIPGQNKEPLHVTVLQQNPSGQTVTVATLTIPFSKLMMWKRANTVWLPLEPKGSFLGNSQPRLKVTIATDPSPQTSPISEPLRDVQTNTARASKEERRGVQGISPSESRGKSVATHGDITSLFTDLPRDSAVLATELTSEPTGERGVVWVELEPSAPATMPRSNASSFKASAPSTPTNLSPEMQFGADRKDSSPNSEKAVDSRASLSAGHWMKTAQGHKISPSENIASMAAMQKERSRSGSLIDTPAAALEEDATGNRSEKTRHPVEAEASEQSEPNTTPSRREEPDSNTPQTVQKEQIAPRQQAPRGGGGGGGGIQGLISRFQQDTTPEPQPAASSTPPPRTPNGAAGSHPARATAAINTISTPPGSAKEMGSSSRGTNQSPLSTPSPSSSSPAPMTSSSPIDRDARDGSADGTQRVNGQPVPVGADMLRGQEFTSMVAYVVQSSEDAAAGSPDPDAGSPVREEKSVSKRASEQSTDPEAASGGGGSGGKQTVEEGGGGVESAEQLHRLAAPAVKAEREQNAADVREEQRGLRGLGVSGEKQRGVEEAVGARELKGGRAAAAPSPGEGQSSAPREEKRNEKGRDRKSVV